MSSISLRQAIEKVAQGQIRIPAFQRPFVWDAQLVALLMDSIYKGFPFGAVVLWRTKTPLRTERALGPFELPDKDPDYPVDYVLDGQQRLTSIFGVFQTGLAPTPDSDTAWTHIYYDFEADKDLQDTRFLALPPDPRPAPRYFPIRTFFDSVAYRVATQHLDEARVREIDGVQTAFREAEIPLQLLETDERDKVAIVFERVNRLGVELDAYQLLSAWAWSEEFDLQDRFRDLAGELQPFGFSDIGEDSTLLLRSCAAVLGEDVSTPKLLELNGTKVRENFDEIANGLRGAVDFLRANLGVQRLGNIPFPAMLVPLAVFFAAKDGVTVNPSNAQREELLRWFWRSCFSRRYSSAVLRNLNRDIEEVRKLRATSTLALAGVTASIDEKWFIENQFNVASVNTKTFVLMLAQAQPLSLVSGTPVNLGQVLQNYNRSEFHHLVPQAFLRGLKVPSGAINQLANFAFISSADNKVLGGVAPSQYRPKMPAGNIDEILKRAITPASLFTDDYERFRVERAASLAAYGRGLAAL